MLTRPDHTHDDGYTLVELLVVMVIMAVVGTMVVTSFVAASRSSARATDRVDALNDLRPAAERLTRDLRAASPLVLDAGGAYDTSVGMQLTRGGEDLEHTYYLTGTAGSWELWSRRERVEADGTVTTLDTGSLVAEVTNTATQPVFTYYDAEGAAITCQATASTAEQLAACRDQHLTASRVDVHVVRSTGDGRPVEFSSSVTIRNARLG